MNASNPADKQLALPASRIDTLPHLRTQLAALTFHSPHLSEAEKLRANHHIHECEDAGRLTHWLRTVKGELARRNIAAQTQKALANHPTPKRQPTPRPHLRSQRHPHMPRRAPKSAANPPARYVVDHRAAPGDCRAATRFQPARTLTYAQLLRR